MRLLVFIAFVGLSTAKAQSVVDDAGVAAARATLDNAPQVPTFDCQIMPIPPELNYALRFETGFTASLPLNEIRDGVRRWDILIRVTPDRRQAVFLRDSSGLSGISRSSDARGVIARFAVGEGGYRVEAVVKDNGARACRSSWRIEARRQSAERGMTPSLAPGTVAALTGMPAAQDPKAEAKVARVTLLVHAAPLAVGHPIMERDDVDVLSSSLRSLLVYVTARSVRVVVFSLHRSAPLYENDDFRASDLLAATKAIDQASPAVIDYKALQYSQRPVSTASRLIRGEMAREKVPDAVVLLGAYTAIPDDESAKLPKIDSPGEVKLFYLQYHQDKPLPPSALPGGPFPVPTYPNPTKQNPNPANQLGDAAPMYPDLSHRPDAIALVTRAMRGEIIEVAHPQQLARAISRILARLGAQGR